MTDSAAASNVTRESLDRAFLHGLAWSAVGRWLSQVFRWVATILTARLLLPVDYGIVGIAMMIVGLLQYVAEFGFGAAIVQQRSLSQTTVRQIGGASVIMALALGLLMVASTRHSSRVSTCNRP
jgi:O-antigen/teichoic acid export membrane protein